MRQVHGRVEDIRWAWWWDASRGTIACVLCGCRSRTWKWSWLVKISFICESALPFALSTRYTKSPEHNRYYPNKGKYPIVIFSDSSHSPVSLYFHNIALFMLLLHWDLRGRWGLSKDLHTFQCENSVLLRPKFISLLRCDKWAFNFDQLWTVWQWAYVYAKT